MQAEFYEMQCFDFLNEIFLTIYDDAVVLKDEEMVLEIWLIIYSFR